MTRWPDLAHERSTPSSPWRRNDHARILVIAGCGAVVVVCACGPSTTPTPTLLDAGNEAMAIATAHCGIDPSFPPSRDSDVSCHAARYFLKCTGAFCLSDDDASCDKSTPEASGVCMSGCAANEYGAECGGLVSGDAGTATPPSRCRAFTPAPNGSYFLCCPCD